MGRTVRKVRISKGESSFCYPEHIPREMHRLFTDLSMQKHLAGLVASAFAQSAAHILAELNAIHPFGEGNGRAQLSFLTVLSASAGHPIVLRRLDPPAILRATLISFGGNEKPLADVIRRLIAKS